MGLSKQRKAGLDWYHVTGTCKGLFHTPSGGGGVLPEKLGGGVACVADRRKGGRKVKMSARLFPFPPLRTPATHASGGVQPASQNPCPIYDQNLRYSLPRSCL